MVLGNFPAHLHVTNEAWEPGQPAVHVMKLMLVLTTRLTLWLLLSSAGLYLSMHVGAPEAAAQLLRSRLVNWCVRIKRGGIAGG